MTALQLCRTAPDMLSCAALRSALPLARRVALPAALPLAIGVAR